MTSRTALVTIAVLVASMVSACGGSSSSGGAPTQAAPDFVSLKASCPQVEAALPSGSLPPAAKWRAFATKVDQISTAGDLETRNAVKDLQRAAHKLASDPANGMPFLNAQQSLLSALDDLAKRCRAAGSSALQ